MVESLHHGVRKSVVELATAPISISKVMLEQMLQSRMICALATHKGKEGEYHLSHGCMQYLGRKDAQRLTTLKEVYLRITATTDWPGICLAS